MNTFERRTSKDCFLLCRGCECQAVVYDRANYGGRSLLIRQQNADLNLDFFDNRVESIKIYGTCDFILYEHPRFEGRSYVLRPGNYYSSHAWGDSGNSISSARALPPRGTTAISLFQHPNFRGRMAVLYNSDRFLRYIDFDDHLSSAIVTGGTWSVYDHPYYTGASVRLTTGHYPNGIFRLGHDIVSSVRRY